MCVKRRAGAMPNPPMCPTHGAFFHLFFRTAANTHRGALNRWDREAPFPSDLRWAGMRASEHDCGGALSFAVGGAGRKRLSVSEA